MQLHALGYLDVSQRAAGGNRYLTAIRVLERSLPKQLPARFLERQYDRQQEVDDLVAWFGSPDCCNARFAAYFNVDPPEETCSHPSCRCSTCLGAAAYAAEPRHRVYNAFMTDRPRPASAEPTARPLTHVDRYVVQLLSTQKNGLGEPIILAVLRGEDFYPSKAAHAPQLLWPSLRFHPLQNVRPGMRSEQLRASLVRLERRGLVTREGGRWRLVATGPQG
jgi:hypothetical protein